MHPLVNALKRNPESVSVIVSEPTPNSFLGCIVTTDTTGAKHVILEGTTQWSDPRMARDVMTETLQWARGLAGHIS